MTNPTRSPDSKRHARPRWVKVSGIIAIVLALVALVVFLIGGGPGGHGPGRHFPGGGEPAEQIEQQQPGGVAPGEHTGPPPGIEHP